MLTSEFQKVKDELASNFEQDIISKLGMQLLSIKAKLESLGKAYLHLKKDGWMLNSTGLRTGLASWKWTANFNQDFMDLQSTVEKMDNTLRKLNT